jgi:hypothetical protein
MTTENAGRLAANVTVAAGEMIWTNAHAGGKVPNGTTMDALSAPPLSESQQNLKS